MKRALIPMLALLALGGCAFQTEAQINAELSRHIGQSETDLVREMGVPTRHFLSGGHEFLAYATGHQTIEPEGGFGPGPFYPGWGGGWGGWGWGGYGYGYGGWAGPSNIITYGCETTFEIGDGKVLSFRRHGNDC
jgi:hypothetical protein